MKPSRISVAAPAALPGATKNAPTGQSVHLADRQTPRPLMKPAPLVLIVGFLGSGKTTFLRDLLPLLEARGLEPFVIINDYANARVDASSLTKEGRTVTPINGNCICCDSVIELMNTLMEIPMTERRIVLIEANGTTDPSALIEHILVNPELRNRFAPLLQVAVVDLKRWQKRHWHNELEHLQVETASHILFSREETVGKDRYAAVRGDIAWFNPKAQWIKRQMFALELEKLSKGLAAPLATPSRPQPACPMPASHGRDHADRHALSHAFVGLQVDLPNPMRANHLKLWLESLPADVIRAKGVVQLREEPGRWFQFQRVDEFAGEAALFELPQKPILPPCAVLIGVKLDEASVCQSLVECGREAASSLRKSAPALSSRAVNP